MQIRTGIQPFNEYWINCLLNMVFSVITSAEPSYMAATYLNDYDYEVGVWETEPSETNTEGNRTIHNHLILNQMQDFLEKYIHGKFSYQPISFRDDEHCLDIIKGHVRQKEFVLVGVDVFYWVPGSFGYGQNHWNHHSFINGYDDEKKVFYIFDEDINGYVEQEIPEERFLLALNKAIIEPHGFIIKPPEHIPPFTFSINDVVKNAEKLINQISTMQIGPFWILTDNDFNTGIQQGVIIVLIYQVMHRHYANELLFRVVLNKYCDTDTISSLVRISKELQNGWSTVKSQMLKVYKSETDRRKILDDVNELVKHLFLKEVEMWNKVVDRLRDTT